MTDSTNQIFNTPYKTGLCDEYGNEVVVNKDVDCVGKFPNIVDAKRFARLPELYDALLDAVEIICGISGEDACEHCSNAKLDLGGPCRILEWRELLQKVRAGE